MIKIAWKYRILGLFLPRNIVQNCWKCVPRPLPTTAHSESSMNYSPDRPLEWPPHSLSRTFFDIKTKTIPSSKRGFCTLKDESKQGDRFTFSSCSINPQLHSCSSQTCGIDRLALMNSRISACSQLVCLTSYTTKSSTCSISDCLVSKAKHIWTNLLQTVAKTNKNEDISHIFSPLGSMRERVKRRDTFYRCLSPQSPPFLPPSLHSFPSAPFDSAISRFSQVRNRFHVLFIVFFCINDMNNYHFNLHNCDWRNEETTRLSISPI